MGEIFKEEDISPSTGFLWNLSLHQAKNWLQNTKFNLLYQLWLQKSICWQYNCECKFPSDFHLWAGQRIWRLGGVKNYIRHQIWKLDGWTACVLKGHFSDNHRNNVDEQSHFFRKCFKEGWISNSKEDDLSGFTIWKCVLFTPLWSIILKKCLF